MFETNNTNRDSTFQFRSCFVCDSTLIREMKITILFLLFAVTGHEVASVGLTEVFSWRQIEYEYGPSGAMDPGL